MKKVLIAALAALPLALASCGGGGTATTPKPAQQVATVTTTTTTNYQRVAVSGGHYTLAVDGVVVLLDEATPDGSPVIASADVKGGTAQVCNAAAFGLSEALWKTTYSCFVEQH